MNDILSLFPANDFSLIAVILAMPLLGAFVNGVFGRRLGKPAVRLMALAAIGISFLAAIVTFAALAAVVDKTSPGMTEGKEVVHHAHAKVSWLAWNWMSTSDFRGSSVPIDLKFSVDALSGVMMLVVTGVGFLIHVYAAAYMAEDKAYWRFFCYLNLFVFAMLVLILGDNLPVLFIGWEGVGLCSYLLIGFWYTKSQNATAGKKAFIMNRIGDFGLICGMFLLVYYTGALDWDGISQNAASLVTPLEGQQVHLWPIGGGQFQDMLIGGITLPLHYLQPDRPWTITAATAVALALFLGCTGKSAQLPLYTWLPDAMAGPTPVSALIHAATMVTAGVYLICRMSFVFVLSPATMTIIAFTGALTALFAAMIAFVQNDIKKVLAYSTVSQLGFMFLGVGVGAFVAGFFHVFTHAFFKACLFLGAGSVIHAMHARVHDDDKAQDMRNMGALRKYMPLTYGTFAAATVAIIGFPLTAGWFSKDEIISSALVDISVNPYTAQITEQAKRMKTTPDIWTAPHWVPWALWAIGVAAATMTAFYMCRCFFLTFWGDKFRGWAIGRPSLLQAVPSSAPLSHGLDIDEGEGEEHGAEDEPGHHHEEDLSLPGHPPHESPRMMTIPLLVLGTASIVAGIVLNPAAFKLFSDKFDFTPMDHWLEPVFAESVGGVASAAANEHAKHSLEMLSLAAALLAFAVGSGIAYWMYVTNKGEKEKEYLRSAGMVAARFTAGIFAVVGVLIYGLTDHPGRATYAFSGIFVALSGYLFYKGTTIGLDEVYEQGPVAWTDALADTAASVDQGIVDFFIARLTSLVVSALGTVLRVAQNGVVHVYAAVMVIGLAALGWFFIQPHADYTVTEQTGDYTITAAPGIDYHYKWTTVKPAPTGSVAAETKPSITRHLGEGDTQTVRLEIRNAFGRPATKDVTITRPKPERPVTIPIGQLPSPGGEK